MTKEANAITAIAELRRRKHAVILAHYYQSPAIQDLADFVGDSLALAQQAAGTTAEIIVLAGVVFMAETAKLLNPDKKVLVPDRQAGCSLADNCPADEFATFLKQYPDHTVITYINSSAAVKALTDIVCTSSNAEKIIQSVPPDRPIVFGPDQHLGRYLQKKSGRKMVLWPGSCEVHDRFQAEAVVRMQARHPAALLIAHPECSEAVLDLAAHIGSTSALLSFVQKSPAAEFIVATESGILHQMRKACPKKVFHAAPVAGEGGCSCAECPYMRLNTLEKLQACLEQEEPEISIAPDLRERALAPIERMLSLSS